MKPFKGIIKDWYRDGDVICGLCEYHADAEPLSVAAMLNNGVVKDYSIHTSRVLKVEDRGAFALCETKNSFYVLTTPKRLPTAGEYSSAS